MDGATVCLPWGGDVTALFWNKALFETAGLDPDRPPATLEELATYAERLTLRNEAGELRQVGFLPDLTRSHTDLYLRLFGGSWIDGDDREPTVDSLPMVEALTWQRGFYDAKATAGRFAESVNRYLDSAHPIYAGERTSCRACHPTARLDKGPDQGFLRGEVAMMLDGQWQLGQDGFDGRQQWFEVGVAPVPPPAGHPERAGTSVIEGPVVFLAAGAQDEAGAAELLAWMTSPEILVDAALTLNKIPTSRAAARDPRFYEIPHFEVFLDLMAHPNAAPTVSTPVSTPLNAIVGEIEKAMRQGKSPADRLTQLQADFAQH
jgi:multiple sugar transport system substrate-binding protein